MMQKNDLDDLEVYESLVVFFFEKKFNSSANFQDCEKHFYIFVGENSLLAYENKENNKNNENI
jgi:hypothetical protein